MLRHWDLAELSIPFHHGPIDLKIKMIKATGLSKQLRRSHRSCDSEENKRSGLKISNCVRGPAKQNLDFIFWFY